MHVPELGAQEVRSVRLGLIGHVVEQLLQPPVADAEPEHGAVEHLPVRVLVPHSFGVGTPV